MGYFLFVDESGQDHQKSPYEVLAGVAVADAEIWPLILELHALEEQYFGMRVSNGPLELKGKKLLKRKTFRHAAQRPPLGDDERRLHARHCLEKRHTHETPTEVELTALGQAKIAFVRALLDLCWQKKIKAFASIVDRAAPVPETVPMLRKDYAFLFERYYYFLEDATKGDVSDPLQGSIVFDELEKSKSHILIDQMAEYFIKTTTGRTRSSRVIPEPFLFIAS